MTEQIETCFKKVRGMAQRSLDLIEAMYAEAKAAQPITRPRHRLQVIHRRPVPLRGLRLPWAP